MVSGAGDSGAGLQQSSSRTYLEYTQGRKRTVRVDIHSRRLMMALPPCREIKDPANLVGVVISEWGPNLHFSYIRFLHKARTAAAGRLLLSGGSGCIVL